MRVPATASIVMTAAAVGAAMAAFVAAMTAWWVLTDPAALASVVESRDWGAFAAALARGVARALFAR